MPVAPISFRVVRGKNHLRRLRAAIAERDPEASSQSQMLAFHEGILTGAWRVRFTHRGESWGFDSEDLHRAGAWPTEAGAPVLQTWSGRLTGRQIQPAGPNGDHMNQEQLNELLLQSLEHEKGGVLVYQTALECALNDDLREEWETYLGETQNHVRVLTDVFHAFGLDPEQQSPGR